MGGSSVPYRSESNQLYVPRLPAIPFFDPAQFPWVSALEAKTDVIRAELDAALATRRDRFSPYIAYNPGDPVNQWRELNHSDRWSVLHLWRAGEPVEENLAQCPATAAALTQVDAAAMYHRYLLGQSIDYVQELSYYDRKRIHNLKYYTWVEQQGKTYAEIQAQWYDDEYWASIPGKADEIDALIDAFNAEVGLT